jgi:hypothetical protein
VWQLSSWGHTWSWGVVVALAVVATIAQQVEFQVARGWSSTAGAVTAVAACFLLPPGLAELVVLVGAALRSIRYKQPLLRAAFNIGSAVVTFTVRLPALSEISAMPLAA